MYQLGINLDFHKYNSRYFCENISAEPIYVLKFWMGFDIISNIALWKIGIQFGKALYFFQPLKLKCHSFQNCLMMLKEDITLTIILSHHHVYIWIAIQVCNIPRNIIMSSGKKN